MKYRWLILILLLLGAYFFGRMSSNQNARQSVKDEVPTRVKNVQVKGDSVWLLADNYLRSSSAQINGVVSCENESKIFAKTAGKFEFGDVSPKTNILFQEHALFYRINMDAALYSLMVKKAQLIEKINVIRDELDERFPLEVVKWMTWKNDLDPSKRFVGTPKFSSAEEREWAIKSGIYASLQEVKYLEKELENYICLTTEKGYVIRWFVKQGDYVKKDQVICTIAPSLSQIVTFSVPESTYRTLDINNMVIFDGVGKKLPYKSLEVNKLHDQFVLSYRLKSNSKLNSWVCLKSKIEKAVFFIPSVLLENDQLTIMRAGQRINLNLKSCLVNKEGIVETDQLQRGDLIKSR